jgi:hypothetical protein
MRRGRRCDTGTDTYPRTGSKCRRMRTLLWATSDGERRVKQIVTATYVAQSLA